MSNTDSFIDEVTEELRNDRMFKLLRRWAWVGVLLVIGIVGGVIWNETRNASEAAASQEFGDALIAGLEAEDAGETLSALSAETPERAVVAQHIAAAAALDGEETDRALSALEAAAGASEVPQIYRDLASLKLALALPKTGPVEDRRAAFEALTVPGGPFRLLALEQLALISIEEGDRDGAIAQLQSLAEEAGLTPGLQRRAAELIVALGGGDEDS